MKPAAIFRQYIWLVNLLRQNKWMTLEEIGQQWVKDRVAEGSPLNRASFYRHRDAIGDMFGIYIECDKENGYKYYIANPQELNDDAIERWMLSTLTVNTVLSDSASLRSRILLETVPAGEHHLQTIIEAIRDNRRLLMGYQKFGVEGYVKTVCPYALKLFHQRWYMLALNDAEQMRIYALDRMTKLELTSETFEMPQDFSPDAYFAEYYGVLTDQTPLAHVVLRAYGKTPDYLRTLPLHPSQREIGSTGSYADFSLDLRPTADFINTLLSHGNGVEVVEPQELRLKICEILTKTLNKY